jgi:hypothetical protein
VEEKALSRTGCLCYEAAWQAARKRLLLRLPIQIYNLAGDLGETTTGGGSQSKKRSRRIWPADIEATLLDMMASRFTARSYVHVRWDVLGDEDEKESGEETDVNCPSTC